MDGITPLLREAGLSLGTPLWKSGPLCYYECTCHSFCSPVAFLTYLRNYLANKRGQVPILLTLEFPLLSMQWVLSKYRLNLSTKGEEHLKGFLLS